MSKDNIRVIEQPRGHFSEAFQHGVGCCLGRQGKYHAFRGSLRQQARGVGYGSFSLAGAGWGFDQCQSTIQGQLVHQGLYLVGLSELRKNSRHAASGHALGQQAAFPQECCGILKARFKIMMQRHVLTAIGESPRTLLVFSGGTQPVTDRAKPG